MEDFGDVEDSHAIMACHHRARRSVRINRKKLNCFMTDDTALHEEREFNVSVTDSEAASLFDEPVPFLENALSDTRSAKDSINASLYPERRVGLAKREQKFAAGQVTVTHHTYGD